MSDLILIEQLKKYTQAVASGEGHIELEIHFKDVDAAVYKLALGSLIGNEAFENVVLETSLDAISGNANERVHRDHDGIKYIRRQVFVKGIKTADEYASKARLRRPAHVSGFLAYTVNVSREEKQRPFSTNLDATLRFKVRISAVHKNFPEWRFDITAVRTGLLGAVKGEIVNIKNQVFRSDLTINNLLEKLPYDALDSYEAEIEFVPTAQNAAATPTLQSIASVTDEFYRLIDPNFSTVVIYNRELEFLAEYIMGRDNRRTGPPSIKTISNAVVSLSKNTYSEIFPPVGYYLTEKADGIRALVTVHDGQVHVCTNILTTVAADPTTALIIVDAELVGGVLYVFDCMAFEGRSLVAESFAVRSGFITAAAEVINESCPCRPKTFTLLSNENLKDSFEKVAGGKYDYEIDGLIMTSPHYNYVETISYKWKSRENTTIDFMAVKCPSELLGVAPYMKKAGKTLYLLFVGIDHGMREKLGLNLLPKYNVMWPKTNHQYYPIQFAPSANPTAYLWWTEEAALDYKIVELSRPDDDWKLIKIRDDRSAEPNYFGNNYRVAEYTYMNYVDEFKFEDLYAETAYYFQSTADEMYKAPNGYKRYVISTFIKNNFANSKFILDLASGRGGDLHRYQAVGVKEALFIDVDATAISELIKRKFALFAGERSRVRHVVKSYDRVTGAMEEKVIQKASTAMTVLTAVMDLTSPASELVDLVSSFGKSPGGADGIVMNFAMHYMCRTLADVTNILKFIATELKVGGVFMFTVMAGDRVFKTLRDNMGKYTVLEGEIVKYSITALYKGDKLAPTGQLISVKLPFRAEELEEPLCNIDVIIAEAAKLHLAVEMNEPLDARFDAFSRTNSEMYERLTADDKTYIGLHSIVSLRRMK